MATLTDSQIAGVAKAAGFSGKNLGIAVAVALAESGGNTEATHKNNNGSTDYGLFQINSIHSALLAGKDWKDPNVNAQMAFKIGNGSNWKPWATYNSGSYLRYLARGNTAAGNPTDVAGGSAGGSATASATDPTAGLSFLTNTAMWARVGIFILGGALLVFAIWKLTGAGDAVVSVAKGAIKARTGISI